MKLCIDPNFMERAVFARTQQESSLSELYGRQFADCYDADLSARQQKFRDLHEQWFEQLGLMALLRTVLAEFPRVVQSAERVLIDAAPSPRNQVAELMGGPGRYAVLMHIHAGAMLDADDFRAWARHELQHIDDILDPAFGYDRQAQPVGNTQAGVNLTRERYALLWAISIDARLSARFPAPEGVKDRRAKELVRAFHISDEAAKLQLDDLWQAAIDHRPTPTGGWLAHTEMLSLARVGLCSSASQDAASGDRGASMAGWPCPLCNFPTHDWQLQFEDDVADAIRADFPNWSPAQAACRRCGELYWSRTLVGS